MATPLRIAFMGTPDFSVPTLRALLGAGHDVAAVYSQPPSRAGRGKKERPSPVHAFAEQHGIPVHTPTSLKSEEEQEKFAALNLDVAVVVAYGLLLPKAILDAPRLGCVNVHASLLPRWRGAAPIHRAIMAGDKESGVDIMMMEEGLDTGPVLLEKRVIIQPEDTTGSLHDALAQLGAEAIVPALEGLADGSLTPRPQGEEGVIYAKKIDKAEARIEWTRPAQELRAHIHGLSPFPGAWCEVEGERLKLLLAEVVTGSGAPGEVIAEPLVVACGDGALKILKAQRAGKGPMLAEDLLRGFPIPNGTILT
ncbi:methionyl-tRNA formyltransferase [Emcibacter nanhaiensis]|uniref:Methionyl-tRNA formyltransferase n=1 Tax=Emcibacter nanhaiensis TaxID=1505037 RepID=A0A501PD51_9PROT|nr:methionyl-tRNA formyltransferase [Emcibacter nanhaiensis]TPD57834.1 methionyl-tRNA formyltransferase [Emcibacter nanhaiensis]